MAADVNPFPRQVRLTRAELERCEEVGRLRQQATGHLDDSYGLPPEQRLLRHVQGAKAEKAVSVELGLPWTPVVQDYREIGGDDVGTLGVRSTDRQQGCLILHPKDEDDRVFVLVVEHADGDFTLVGWITGAEGKDSRYWRTDVRHPAFFVPQHALHWSPLP